MSWILFAKTKSEFPLATIPQSHFFFSFNKEKKHSVSEQQHVILGNFVIYGSFCIIHNQPQINLLRDKVGKMDMSPHALFKV